jgi:tyrosinase
VSFRNHLEGFHGDPAALHNLVHVWDGGFMNSMESPLDPIFWLHHSFVDRIWFEWQLEFGFDTYLPFEDGPEGHNLFDLLGGFDNVLLADTLDPRTFDGVGFYYEGLPIPEPATVATLFGTLVFLFVLRQRSLK